MNDWLRLATRRPVARRALKYAIGVGTLLIVINHGDALARGDISAVRLLRMLLTMSVPYLVSTASSVGALRDRSVADGQRSDPDARVDRGAD